jgi:hypothetical protein
MIWCWFAEAAARDRCGQRIEDVDLISGRLVSHGHPAATDGLYTPAVHLSRRHHEMRDSFPSPTLAAQIGDRNAGLVLLQNPDDPLFHRSIG